MQQGTGRGKDFTLMGQYCQDLVSECQDLIPEDSQPNRYGRARLTKDMLGLDARDDCIPAGFLAGLSKLQIGLWKGQLVRSQF